jgi:hypothetical protein
MNINYAAIAQALKIENTASFREIINLVEASSPETLVECYEQLNAWQQQTASAYLQYSYNAVPSYVERFK